MKKLLVILGVMLLAGYSLAIAEVLNDAQLAGVYAGDVDTAINDDIIAENSAVSNQKNIAVVGSTDGSVSGTSIGNLNTATVDNIGDSAVALQTNIAAIGVGGAGTSSGNTINNENTAGVDNLFLNGGTVDAVSDGSTNSGAGSNSAFTIVTAINSAAASQSNIGVVAGSGTIEGTTINNSNTATVINTPGAL